MVSEGGQRVGALQIVRGGAIWPFFSLRGVQFSKLRGGARVGLSGLKGGAPPPPNYTYDSHVCHIPINA